MHEIFVVFIIYNALYLLQFLEPTVVFTNYCLFIVISDVVIKIAYIILLFFYIFYSLYLFITVDRSFYLFRSFVYLFIYMLIIQTRTLIRFKTAVLDVIQSPANTSQFRSAFGTLTETLNSKFEATEPRYVEDIPQAARWVRVIQSSKLSELSKC